jgi:hypothetical protein
MSITCHQLLWYAALGVSFGFGTAILSCRPIPDPCAVNDASDRPCLGAARNPAHHVSRLQSYLAACPRTSCKPYRDLSLSSYPPAWHPMRCSPAVCPRPTNAPIRTPVDRVMMTPAAKTRIAQPAEQWKFPIHPPPVEVVPITRRQPNLPFHRWYPHLGSLAEPRQSGWRMTVTQAKYRRTTLCAQAVLRRQVVAHSTSLNPPHLPRGTARRAAKNFPN